MPRLPRVRGLPSLHQVAAAPSSSCSAIRSAPFAASIAASRSISTSAPLASKNTQWIRGKLWKGEAPGPEDPYTQRPEPEETSNLPDEAQTTLSPRRDNTPYAVQNTRLVLPPKRTEAVAEKELESVDPSYTPATSIEGLEKIATVENWWQQPGHWGEESKFRGFANPAKIQDRVILEVCMRRAVVEALALQQEGLFQTWLTKKWRAGERSDLDQLLALQVKVEEDGKVTLSGDVSGVTGRLTSDAAEEKGTLDLKAEEAAELIASWDAEWKTIELDEEIKFAVRKRIYQLTGVLIPDAKLAASHTVSHLITLTIAPAIKNNTKKLAWVIKSKHELATLRNVAIHERKQSVIDKEKAIGRWKVIEEELEKRDLPVTGTADLGRNKEREWLSGRV